MIPLPKASILLHLTGVTEPVAELIGWNDDEPWVDAHDFVLHELDSDEPAGWRILGDTIFHSKTLAAVTVQTVYPN